MKAQLQQLLTRYHKHHLTARDRIAAAVLVPLYQDEDGWNIVFIKRTWNVSTHKGQISFPGGARDVIDADLKATALRESWEEIGLKPEDAEVIGELDDEFTTTSNYIMTPFVGIVPWPYAFIPNHFEVEKIVTVPLTALLDVRNMAKDTETLDGVQIPSYSYHYQGKVIWGATARILYKFLDLLKQVL